jgi:2-polyprenyl-6-methoxyphenol hydroxylase-like FAD-dependent oxidoreductase
MSADYDVVVIGAGAAGSAASILLAEAGWRVAVVEQNRYPRRKVCGECIAAGNLPLLDGFGLGAAFRASAGPELKQVAWMDAGGTVTADMPPCTSGPYAYGRALGRDRLDTLLVQRAKDLGVVVLQPAKVRSVSGEPGDFHCAVDFPGEHAASAERRTLRSPVVIDAHGSWERNPVSMVGAKPPRHRRSDLLAFKATFRHAALPAGLLPVLSLPGGYGGMVVGDDGRTTLACCLRRDALARCRNRYPGATAGLAVERFLIDSCPGVRAVLRDAVREGTWLSVGPLRPGVRVNGGEGVFRIGNAAGESHPLIGEGISMALQSAALLAANLRQHHAGWFTPGHTAQVQRSYADAWRRAFAPRLRLAALYAHIAMRPALALPARYLLRFRPSLLRDGARLAGKARHAVNPLTSHAETA